MPATISRETSRRLAATRALVKSAEIGGDGTDGTFEQSFSNLAHAFMKDRAPSLLDYEVGFQLMERNNDNTKAIGIFGFKVGSQWLYAPVFFLNGDLKGTELLYIKAQDQFVPLAENWLNHLLQRKPNVLGKEVQPNLGRLGVLSPDLQAFSKSPGKFAYHLEGGRLRVKVAGTVRVVPEPLVDGVAAFAHCATTSPFAEPKYKNLPDLPTFLKSAGKEVLVTLLRDLMDYPALATGFERFYGGLGVVKEAIDLANERERKGRDVLEKLALVQYTFGQPVPASNRGRQPAAGNGGVLTTGNAAFASLDGYTRSAVPAWTGDRSYTKTAAGPFVPTAMTTGGAGSGAHPAGGPVAQPAPNPYGVGGPTMTGGTVGGIGAGEAPKLGPWGKINNWLDQKASWLPSKLPGGRATAGLLGLGALGLGVGAFGAARRRKTRDELMAEQLAKAGGAANYKRGPKGPFEELIGEPKPKAKPKSVLDPDPMPAKAAKLEVITPDTIAERGVAWEPTEDEKINARVDGVAFRDERDEPEVSRAYEVQTQLRLSSPHETGIYNLLTQPTAFDKVVVFVGPYSDEGKKDFATVVSAAGDKKWLNIHPANLWCQSDEVSPTTYRQWWDKLPDSKDLKASWSAVYMLVGPDGEATTPFEVRKNLGGDETSTVYSVWYKDYASQGRPSNFPTLNRQSGDYWSSGGEGGCSPGEYTGPTLVVTDKDGGKIRVMNSGVYVPGNYKVLTLKPDTDKPEDKKNYLGGDSDRSDPPPLRPGTKLDVEAAIYSKTASLRLEHTGSVLTVNDVPMHPDYALVHLVRDWGFREKAARILVKKAANEKAWACRVELAPGHPVDPAAAHLEWLKSAAALVKAAGPGDPMDPAMMGGVTAPPFPAPPTGMEPTLQGGVQAQYPQQETMPVMPPGSQSMNPGSDDPRIPPDPGAMAVGVQAAQTGQREVFDTAMVGSLLRSVRTDTMVDRHLGDLLKGLDKIGRILFSYYWHGEEFAERYGKKDMPELEDSLRNAFEQLGDVVLFLMQKTIQPFPDETSNVDLGATAEA